MTSRFEKYQISTVKDYFLISSMNNGQGFQRKIFPGLSRPKVPLPVEQEGTGGASTNPYLKPY